MKSRSQRKILRKMGIPTATQEINKLAKRIKGLRKEGGYKSYASFAEKHKLSRALYGRYEKGKDLRFSTLVKIVEAHKITLKEFFSEGF